MTRTGRFASCAVVLLTTWAASAAHGQTMGAAASPTLAEARKMLAAAQAAAAKANANLSCAVVDARGDIVSIERGDKARFFTVDVARGKALTSATFGAPSANVANLASSPLFPGINASAQGRMYPMQGAVPLTRNSQVLGAIGCSGGTGQQDEDAAKSGAAAL